MKLDLSAGIGALLLTLATSASADVTITQKAGTLELDGDAASDVIGIEGLPAFGELTVSVNSAPPKPFIGVQNIRLVAGDGGDSVFLSAVHVGGNVRLKLGDGGDLVTIDDLGPTNEHASCIGGTLEILMGGDAKDVVHVFGNSVCGVSIGENFVVKGVADLAIDGNGGTSAFEETDVNVAGDLRIQTAFAIDVNLDGFTLAIDDVNVGGKLTIDLGASFDHVRLDDTHVGRTLDVDLGDGDDDFVIGDCETNAAVKVNGAGGFDRFNPGPQFPNVFAIKPQLTKVEQEFN